MSTREVSASFTRFQWCPVHGLPLMTWHRVGKHVCPQRECPYLEPHSCEVNGEQCGCDLVETTITVPVELTQSQYDEAKAIMHRRVFFPKVSENK